MTSRETHTRLTLLQLKNQNAIYIQYNETRETSTLLPFQKNGAQLFEPFFSCAGLASQNCIQNPIESGCLDQKMRNMNDSMQWRTTGEPGSTAAGVHVVPSQVSQQLRDQPLLSGLYNNCHGTVTQDATVCGGAKKCQA